MGLKSKFNLKVLKLKLILCKLDGLQLHLIATKPDIGFAVVQLKSAVLEVELIEKEYKKI